MAEICHRSRKPVYAADNPVRIGSLCFNPNFFTCAATGVKLTHKTAVVKDGEVYHVNHVPKDMPTAAIDVTMQGHLNAPDSTMGTRQFAKSDASHSYGAGSVQVASAQNAPKPPSNVNNINKMEVRHQGCEKFN